MVKIRSTQSNDRDAVVAVVRAAFSSDGHDPQEEVDIVTETWARGAAPEGLDLVAVEDAIVVGYVVAARGRLSDTDVLGVAPLAVTPGRQRAGIGTALVQELIARADANRWQLLLLLGDPAYYERFGFEPTGNWGSPMPRSAVTTHTFRLANSHATTLRCAEHSPTAGKPRNRTVAKRDLSNAYTMP